MTGSIWVDVLLFVVFITVLSIAMFRLDTIMSASRPKPNRPQKRFSGPDASGDMVLVDPDGRTARRKRRRK